MTDPRWYGEPLDDVLSQLPKLGVHSVRLVDLTSKKAEGYPEWRVVKVRRDGASGRAELWVCRFPGKP